MNLKMMKRLAEREIFRYRDNRAYMQGILDACGEPARLKEYERVLWVRAVDCAKAYWEKEDPLKAAFFAGYYRTDRPKKRYEQKPSIRALAMQLHVSEPTLYKWRSELVTTVVLAAIQAGALQPYRLPDENGTAQNGVLCASGTMLCIPHGNE